MAPPLAPAYRTVRSRHARVPKLPLKPCRIARDATRGVRECDSPSPAQSWPNRPYLPRPAQGPLTIAHSGPVLQMAWLQCEAVHQRDGFVIWPLYMLKRGGQVRIRGKSVMWGLMQRLHFRWPQAQK